MMIKFQTVSMTMMERWPTQSTCYVEEFDRGVSANYSLTQNSVASEVGSEMRASKQTETVVDSAIAAALKELHDESKYYNIADCDGSESVTVQVGSEVDEAEDSDCGAGSQPDQSESIVESDVISVLRLRQTMNVKYPEM
ncbi:hypothetical protein GN244_ATG10445 [Phytophthora infestans]|uniref:Uncharacterized protein n=1 Tax=Phytophthora infestans TaxID=4787 RepID=A0A833SQV5_PHYIN|nr:hypothetical protein GN244_ATG10445 [Phytophthora infestans]